MPLQRPGDVNGRDPAGRANRYAKAGFKEPITLILGQAPRRPVGGWAPWRGEPRAPQGGAGASRRAAGGHIGGEAGGGKAVARGRRWRAAGRHRRGGGRGGRGRGGGGLRGKGVFFSYTYFSYTLLQGECGQCRMTGCAPFVWRDHQLQVRDAFRRYGPYLALKRGARWTEGILLAQQYLVSLPSVSRDCHLNLLRTA